MRRAVHPVGREVLGLGCPAMLDENDDGEMSVRYTVLEPARAYLRRIEKVTGGLEFVGNHGRVVGKRYAFGRDRHFVGREERIEIRLDGCGETVGRRDSLRWCL